MSPALLPALLGLTLVLPGAQALTCHSGSAIAVRNATELPLTWTVGEEDCREGWGCQDTVMLLENGPLVLLVITKGCTQEEDQEARVTQHWATPGLSIVSYTHVCRREDLCNDLSSTRSLSTPPPPTFPGTVRCPVCLSTEGCETAPEVTCPVGHTHCYNGILQLRGAFRTCQKGIMLRFKENLAKEPVEWDAFTTVKCDLDEVCQETLLLIDVGPRSLIVGSKGCSKAETPDSQTVSIHSGPPRVLAASYTHFCSSNGCNNASSTSVLLNSLPGPAAPAAGDLQCPACVQLGGLCTGYKNVMCPKGTTHRYKGDISLNGGGLSSPLSIQGCMAQPSNSLLRRTNRIGPFIVAELPKDGNKVLQSGAAPAPYLAQVVGLGLSLALWCAVTSLLTLFPCDS